jgi:hypothetical protein
MTSNCKKARATKKKKAEEKSITTRLFCISRKIDKKYHIHQNYNVFVDKLTKSLHFLLLTSIETVYLQEYFFIEYGYSH